MLKGMMNAGEKALLYVGILGVMVANIYTTPTVEVHANELLAEVSVINNTIKEFTNDISGKSDEIIGSLQSEGDFLEGLDFDLDFNAEGRKHTNSGEVDFSLQAAYAAFLEDIQSFLGVFKMENPIFQAKETGIYQTASNLVGESTVDNVLTLFTEGIGNVLGVAVVFWLLKQLRHYFTYKKTKY